MAIVKDLLVSGDARLDGDVSISGAIDSTSLREMMLDIAHPVGSYYWSSDSTDPGELFGGTWTQITDRFIYAAGSKGVGATGGEESHTLSVSEMPSHTHNVGYSNSAGNYVPQGVTTFSAFRTGSSVYEPAINGVLIDVGRDGYTSNHFNQETGGGGTHNNMPPYLVAYCWRRTA